MNDTTTLATTPPANGSEPIDQFWWDQVVEFCDARDEMLIPIAIVLGVALIINIIQVWVLSRFALRMSKGGFRWSAVIASSASRPLGFIIWILALSIAIQMFIEPDPAKRMDSNSALRIGQFRTGFVLLLCGWFLSRMIRSYEKMLTEPREGGGQVDLTIIRAISNFLIVLVWLGTLLIAMQTYGVNMTAIITLGGASSFALTFAFQDVFKNLFGGVMILFSRPFRIGDDIELRSRSIAGTIERIGLYQTCIRGWDKVPIILPNSIFLTDPIMNLSKATHRRVRLVIGLRYDDFNQVRTVSDEITEMLKSHDEVDKGSLLRVVFNNFGASSLDLQVTCHSPAGYSMGQAAFLQQDIMLRIGKIVASHGAEFAFPTTTIDMPAKTSPAT